MIWHTAEVSRVNFFHADLDLDATLRIAATIREECARLRPRRGVTLEDLNGCNGAPDDRLEKCE